jgi:hypothetical protein
LNEEEAWKPAITIKQVRPGPVDIDQLIEIVNVTKNI